MNTALSNVTKIKCIIFDVDGVMTDGQIIYTNQNEIKSFNSKDGFGITMAIAAGIKVGIITARESEIVQKRANELQITDLYMGQRDKKRSFEEIKSKYQFNDSEIAYMGDDLIDIPVLQVCGLSASPSDAVDDVKSIVDFVSILCQISDLPEGEYILYSVLRIPDTLAKAMPIRRLAWLNP